MTAGEVARAEVRPPWAFSLPLRNGMDGLTRVRRGVLERLLHHGDEPVLIRVAQPSRDRVVFVARAERREAADWGVERMRLSLGVDQDLKEFHERFRFDPLIGRAVRSNPGLRAPGRPEPFEALAWAICEQLIEFERAAAIERRLIWTARAPLPGDRAARLSDGGGARRSGACAAGVVRSLEPDARARSFGSPARSRPGASTCWTPSTSAGGAACARSAASAAGRCRCWRSPARAGSISYRRPTSDS